VTAERWVVSAYAFVSWQGGQVALTSATSGMTFVTDDLELVRIVQAFAFPKTIDDALREIAEPAPERLRHRMDDLIRAGILAAASEREAAAAQHWEPSALAFHRRSRQSDLGNLREQRTPPVAPPASSEWIPLARDTVEAGRDFASVLEARHSERAWPAVPVRFETFSRLLWLSARNRWESKASASDAYVSRPYPSGGAAYSLEIYPVVATDAVEALDAGVYRYLPEHHGLELVSTRSADLNSFLEAAARSAGADAPPIVLLITSRFARQGELYGSLAYSLILKEVGCLFQTLYLVAEYLGLAACALGGGTPAGRLARLRATSELVEPVVGEFLLGPR
jgi:SagB-type dehydrogenase family enzyme